MASAGKLPFEFAVGVECTMIVDEREQDGTFLRKLEEFELMRHYDMWRQDFELIASLRSANVGVSKVRWCLPWHKIEAQPGKYDFDWCDRAVAYAGELGIDLVPDLQHYGTPLWMENAFLHPDYIKRVAAFAAACAQRYKGKIRHYTPLNEPAMTGYFSSILGQWPPYRKDFASFVEVMVRCMRGLQECVKEMRAIDPGLQMWAVEVINHYRAANARSVDAAEESFRKDLLWWDMMHGKVNQSHEFYRFLINNGASPEQVEETCANGIRMDILGVNFYPWSCKVVELQDGAVCEKEATDGSGAQLLELLRRCHEHTGANMFITETSAHGGGGKRSSSVLKKAGDMRSRWLDETIEAVKAARREGLPVLGYTQFPLFTMVDWEYRVQPGTPEDYFMNLGMVEVDPVTYERRRTPVVERFIEHMDNFEVEAPNLVAN